MSLLHKLHAFALPWRRSHTFNVGAARSDH